MVAVLQRQGFTVDAIDVFCGFGGSSQGIHAAGATVRAAANHNQLAIECHAANFPDVDHWRADLVDPESADYRDPAELPAARFAWFSPSCTHHSQANAQKIFERGLQMAMFEDEDGWDEQAFVNSERSRVTMSCVLRYVERHHPEIVVVENVVEVTSWGPGRDGSTFRWWYEELEKMGYDIEPLFLNSQFFPPCPQSRDRIYIVAWRKGNKKPDLDYRPTAYCDSDLCGGKIVQAVQTWKPRTSSWKLARVGKYGAQYYYSCPDCRRRVEPVAWPAYSAIDWSNLGPTLGERSKPLAPKTVERIRRGLTKFRGGPPIVIPCKSVYGADRSVGFPFTTQTTQQDKALVVEGMVVPLRTKGVTSHAGDSIGTVTSRPAQALASDFVGHAVFPSGHPNDSSRGPVDPMFTVLSGGKHGCLATEGFAGDAVLVSGQTNDSSRGPSDPLFTAMASGRNNLLATDGITLAAAGNTYEKPGSGYVRGRPLSDPLFTQHATQAFGFAHIPYLVEMRGGGSPISGQHAVSDPLHTVTAGGGHHGLVSPGLFAKFNGEPGDTAWHHIAEQLRTITGRDTTGLVILPWVDQWRTDPVAVTEQLATVMSHLRHALASIRVDEIPVTDEDLLNVRFRMLDPDPELRRAMAFGDRYILLGNKTQMTSGLGNAVTPPVARWICARCMDTLAGLPRAA